MNRALALSLLLAALPAAAQESRPFNPIGRPPAASPPGTAPAAVTPPAARPVPPPELTPRLREAVMRTVQRLAEAWNTPALGEVLSPRYYDRHRLLDALVTKVPRDAVLRILGVQSMQVLSSEVRPTENGLEEEVVTKVSVTLRTQVEFNDPAAGFQRLEGLNEAIFSFREVR